MQVDFVIERQSRISYGRLGEESLSRFTIVATENSFPTRLRLEKKDQSRSVFCLDCACLNAAVGFKRAFDLNFRANFHGSIILLDHSGVRHDNRFLRDPPYSDEAIARQLLNDSFKLNLSGLIVGETGESRSESKSDSKQGRFHCKKSSADNPPDASNSRDRSTNTGRQSGPALTGSKFPSDGTPMSRPVGIQ